MSKNFKHLTSPEDMVSLSSTAKQKINKWLQEKGYGMAMPDGEFFPTTQLSVSQMIEFLGDDYIYALVKNIGESGREIVICSAEVCDSLFEKVKEILEEKN